MPKTGQHANCFGPRQGIEAHVQADDPKAGLAIAFELRQKTTIERPQRHAPVIVPREALVECLRYSGIFEHARHDYCPSGVCYDAV